MHTSLGTDRSYTAGPTLTHHGPSHRLATVGNNNNNNKKKGATGPSAEPC